MLWTGNRGSTLLLVISGRRKVQGSLGVREGEVKVGLGLSRKGGKSRILRGVLSRERGFRGGTFWGAFFQLA